MFFGRTAAKNGKATESSKPTKKHYDDHTKDEEEDLTAEELIIKLRERFDRFVVNELSRRDDEIAALKETVTKQNEFMHQVIFKLLDKPAAKSATEMYLEQKKEREAREEAAKAGKKLP